MSSTFKIPKKKQPEDSDSAHIHLQSPLSRLHDSASQHKGFGSPARRAGADRVHAGNAVGSFTATGRAPTRQPFRDYVQTLLTLDGSSKGGPSAANHRSAGSWSSQWRQEQRGACSSNGWRPKRASDRLLQPEDASDVRHPPQDKRLSVESEDSLAELRAQGHAGRLSSSPPRSNMAANGKKKKKTSSSSGRETTSEDESASPSRTRTSGSNTASSSSVSKTPSSLIRTVDVMETQRDRWRGFRDRKSQPAALHPKLKKPRPAPSEPIVLSSEEEEEPTGRTSARRLGQKQVLLGSDPPSYLQLEFSSLHFGLMEAGAGGLMTITETGIILPVKGTGPGSGSGSVLWSNRQRVSPGSEASEVTVVASQLRGYGVWDGGVAVGGALLAGWEGPAPSLLFLWVSEAQANLLQRELSLVQMSSAAADAPSCSFLLVKLKQQLPELQAALLASILDMEEYRQRLASPCPIDWSHGLLLLHAAGPPLDQHLLWLLGRSPASGQSGGADGSSGGLLPARLVQYPLVPCKGRITVTEEDLACLDAGEFLNDVIIDFYLKYLLLDHVGGTVAQRTHVFSSFFYRQLSRRRAAGESHAPSVPDRHTRHQRVKTWTRHLDIFSKDFLFVPVNQEAHWFLVVVCFPGLEDVQEEEFCSGAGGSERAAARPDPPSQQPVPLCSLLGCRRTTVTKRPCILVMDSLKLSYHDDVCRLIRDYLQVEWEEHRKKPRLFSADSMRSCRCRVPQQDNSSDCGVYLLQYAESFLQNPVVHFDLPVQLDNWFPRQRVRQKRGEIRSLIMGLHQTQLSEQNRSSDMS